MNSLKRQTLFHFAPRSPPPSSALLTVWQSLELPGFPAYLSSWLSRSRSKGLINQAFPPLHSAFPKLEALPLHIPLQDSNSWPCCILTAYVLALTTFHSFPRPNAQQCFSGFELFFLFWLAIGVSTGCNTTSLSLNDRKKGQNRSYQTRILSPSCPRIPELASPLCAVQPFSPGGWPGKTDHSTQALDPSSSLRSWPIEYLLHFKLSLISSSFPFAINCVQVFAIKRKQADEWANETLFLNFTFSFSNPHLSSQGCLKKLP